MTRKYDHFEDNLLTNQMFLCLKSITTYFNKSMCVVAFLLSERNKKPEDRRSMMDYHRPRSNSDFNITCNIDGADYRQPVIWTKDGQPVYLSKPSILQIKDRGRTIKFPSILRSQSGIYRCQIGKDDKMAIVDVKPESVDGKPVSMRRHF